MTTPANRAATPHGASAGPAPHPAVVGPRPGLVAATWGQAVAVTPRARVVRSLAEAGLLVLGLLGTGGCLVAPEEDDDAGVDDDATEDDDDATEDDDATVDDDATADDDTTPTDDDTTADDDTTPPDDDTSVSDDDTTPSDDDTTPSDDDTTPSDDDTSASDDDATVDDDTTPSDDDTTAEPPGLLDGSWTLDMAVYVGIPGTPYTVSFVIRMYVEGTGTHAIEGYFDLYYYDSWYGLICTDVFETVAGEHRASTLCPDCVGVVKAFDFDGPQVGGCDGILAADDRITDLDLELIVLPLYYSNVVEPVDEDIANYVAAREAEGKDVAYLVYGDVGEDMAEMGVIYRDW